MGTWSQLAGNMFLEWLAQSAALKWVDIGCGNGAFTEIIVNQCAPTVVDGVDPSEEMLAFARKRSARSVAEFREGDAMALPFSDKSFDIATMALVIYFVPDPANGVAEMARVTSPGGTVAAYSWDLTRGAFPMEPVWDEMRALGVTPTSSPSVGASRMEAMRDLWASAGLDAVESKEIVVQRTFADFADFWAITTAGNLARQFAEMPAPDVELLKARVSSRMPTDAAGRITYSARANALKGLVPR